MKDKDGMTYDELIDELKSMKNQIKHHRRIIKEMNKLDVEYWFVHNQERKGLLPTIELPNASRRDS